jgi:diaminopropionate ammonia-lyase
VPEFLPNRHRQPDYRALPPAAAPLEVHRRLPGYTPTPLVPLPVFARRFGLGSLHLKDESRRLGLPAYKVLGASWATIRLLEERHPALGGWRDIADLRQRLAELPRLRLVSATDGNHGRGVARVARWLGFEAEIYVPAGTKGPRIEGIESEGGRVIEVPGTYDETVARAAAVEGPDVLLIQDHGWPGYERVPGLVAEGYATIFAEIDAELAARGEAAPEVVLVQIGVGTLASAVVYHYRRPGLETWPRLVGVEPMGAACALRSIEAGSPVLLEAGADASIMAGLNCGAPSSAAWPAMRDGIDAFVAVEDEQARAAMRLLAGAGVVSGESGAAGLAGLLELCEGESRTAAAHHLRLAGARVLLLSTEGATDPAGWEAAVGRTLPG